MHKKQATRFGWRGCSCKLAAGSASLRGTWGSIGGGETQRRRGRGERAAACGQGGMSIGLSVPSGNDRRPPGWSPRLRTARGARRVCIKVCSGQASRLLPAADSAPTSVSPPASRPPQPPADVQFDGRPMHNPALPASGAGLIAFSASSAICSPRVAAIAIVGSSEVSPKSIGRRDQSDSLCRT
jgi:hypothetical protein